MKQVLVRFGVDPKTEPDTIPELTGLLVIPESSVSSTDFRSFWNSESGDFSDFIPKLINAGVLGGGAPAFWPGGYSGTYTPDTIPGGYLMNAAAPYTKFIYNVSFPTPSDMIWKYIDEDGFGIKWRPGSRLTFYDGEGGTDISTTGMVCVLGQYAWGTSNRARASGLFMTSDGRIGFVALNLNRNNSTYVICSESLSTRILAWIDSLPGGGGSDDPYANIGGDDPIPGGGTVPIPGLPPLSAVDTGIIGLFAPSSAEMRALADFMWTDFGEEVDTIEEILKELVQAVKRSISNPLDYVIGLNIIPSQGLSVGASRVVRFGYISSGVSMPSLTNQYFIVDCGSIFFDTVCGDTFLDYAPYSKFSIYLPYIGFKDVDANDFVGHDIGVVYHGDTVTGGITAYITKDGSVMYQYSGCCALTIPLSSDSWGNTISGAIQVAATIATGAIGGAAAGSGAAEGASISRANEIRARSGISAANTALNPSMLGPQVSHSGAVSGGAGAMGVQFPFVVREAVRFHSTENFNTLHGYPSHYYRQLGQMSGYTSVVDVHLQGVPCTEPELAEIEELLFSGVII